MGCYPIDTNKFIDSSGPDDNSRIMCQDSAYHEFKEN
jgi:hypothetical protein